ncbi:MAG: hypothetical protein ACI8XO_001617 [Verrucomicrobiales bacterium]|jgi:hypothetical protein
MGCTDDPANEQNSILCGADIEKGAVTGRMPLPFKLPAKIGGNQEED